MATAGTRWRDRACSGRKNQAAAKVSPLLNITSRFSIGTVRSLRSTRILRSWFCGIGEQCGRSEEHTSELQSQSNLVCRLLLEKKKKATMSDRSLTIRTRDKPA